MSPRQASSETSQRQQSQEVDFSPEAQTAPLPANSIVTKSGPTLSDAAAGFHKAFQEQLLDKHAAQQREIASALKAAEAAEKKEPPLRPGRKSKAEAAQDAASGVGPVQAALQRRNKLKQQAAAEAAAEAKADTESTVDTSPTVNEPETVGAAEQVAAFQAAQAAQAALIEQAEQAQNALLAAQQRNQMQHQQQSSDPTTGEMMIIKADLSIAHDAIPQEPVQRFVGAPPVGKRRGPAGSSQPQVPQQAADPVPQQAPNPVPQQAPNPVPQTAAGSVPQQAPGPVPQQASDPVPQQPAAPVSKPAPWSLEPALAESFQPAPQSDDANTYSSLSSDVPPGVVIHAGPVPKAKKKETPPAPGNFEDPNLQPGTYAVPPTPTETVASYDYTLPSDVTPQAKTSEANAQGYVPPAPDEQQKMYQMFEPPHEMTTEELLAEALAKQDVETFDQPFDLDQVDQFDSVEASRAAPFGQPPNPTDSDDDGSHDSESYDYETGYPAPQVEEYNYTAPQDPAAWEGAEEDFEHRPRCTGCGTYLEVGSQFCGECGHRLEARIPGCHLCGSPLEPSAKFCGECGSKCVAPRPSTPVAPERILDPHRIPDRQSEEYEEYLAQSAQKPTQRSWVVKLLKMLET